MNIAKKRLFQFYIVALIFVLPVVVYKYFAIHQFFKSIQGEAGAIETAFNAGIVYGVGIAALLLSLIACVRELRRISSKPK